MIKYFFLSFVILSCSKKSTDNFTVEYFANSYQNFFISNCFYYYTDNKAYKEGLDCNDHLFLNIEERVYLDSLVESLKYKLNFHILKSSENRISMYLYGPNYSNILDESLKGNAVSTAPPTYFCVTEACMEIVRSKEFKKRAKDFAKKRYKEYIRQNKSKINPK